MLSPHCIDRNETLHAGSTQGRRSKLAAGCRICCRIRLGAHTTDHGIIRDQQPLPEDAQEWRRELGRLKADFSVKAWSGPEALFASVVSEIDSQKR